MVTLGWICSASVNTCVVRLRLAVTITRSSSHTFSLCRCLTDKRTHENLCDSAAQTIQGSNRRTFFFSSFFGFDKCSINSAVYCVVIKFHCLVNMRVVFVEEA